MTVEELEDRLLDLRSLISDPENFHVEEDDIMRDWIAAKATPREFRAFLASWTNPKARRWYA
jgi:hypothetical protein